jgi:hypothetical protein
MTTGGFKKYRVFWTSDTCHHSEPSCRCTLTVHFPDVVECEIAPIVVPKLKDGKYLSYPEQLWEVIKYIISNYTLDANDRIRPLKDVQQCARDLLQAGFEFMSTQTNTLISAPFQRKNRPQPITYEVPPVVEEIFTKIDRYYLELKYGYIEDDYKWTTSPTTDRMKEIKQMSLANCAFGEIDGYKCMVNTADNIDNEKIIKLFNEYSKNDGISRYDFDKVAKWMPKALQLLNKHLCVEKYRGKYVWTYRKSMLRKMVTTPLASSGIRPGISSTVEDGGVKYCKTATGKKVDQFPYYAKQYHNFIRVLLEKGDNYRRDADAIIDYYNHLSMKNEYKFVYPPTAEECKALVLKCREFFIPNMFMQFLSRHLMAARQYLERGNWIKIGHNWNRRGAEEIAIWLWAGVPGMLWNTGDFTKLDKSIRDWVLSAYIASGKQYYRTESLDEEQLLKDLFEILCEKINVKLVNHIGDMWTLMRAWMYSGGYETSHGDSWAVMLYFMLFMVSKIEEYPDRAEEITKALACGLIRAVIYGDDHIWCCPEGLTDILNEKEWAAFVYRYTGNEIRDCQTTKVFYTTYNAQGEVETRGVVFLKRYFIQKKIVDAPGFPTVYPFKPTHETLLRLVVPREHELIYPLAAIGQAYDTMGTNPVSYELLRQFYYNMVTYLTRKYGKDEAVLIAEAIEMMDPTKLRRLQLKSGRTTAHLIAGFPSLETLLERHYGRPYNGIPNNKIEVDDFLSFFDLEDDC